MKSQFSSSIKSKNTSNMSTIQQQYQAFLTQINTLTQKLAADKATVQNAKASRTQQIQQLQPVIQQAKSLAGRNS